MITLRMRSEIFAHCAVVLLAAGPLAAQTAFLVDDLALSPFGNGGSHPSFTFRIGNRAAFSASDALGQSQLWTTDGSAAGTELLPGVSAEALPRGSLRGKTLFTGPRPENPYHPLGRLALWLSDGTAAGTERLAPRDASITLAADRVAGDAFYVFVDDPVAETTNLMAHTGTPGGLHLVAALGPRTPVGALVAGDRLFFLAAEERIRSCFPDDPCEEILHWKVWVSDGSPSGTRPIADAGTGPTYLVSPGLHHATSEGVYFSVSETSASRTRLFFTRGRGGPPRQLAESHTASALSFMPRFLPDGEDVIFAATGERTGTELWVSDGTAARTRRASDLPSPVPFTTLINPEQVIRLGDRILFAADDLNGHFGLWSAEPGSRDTVQLTDLACAQCSTLDRRSNLVVHNGRVLFVAPKASGKRALWQSDGTPEGTELLFDPGSGATDGISINLIADGGTVYFSAATAGAGWELFRLAPEDLAPRALTAFADVHAVDGLLSGLRVGSRFLFAASIAEHGDEPWSVAVNPNPASAHLVSDLVVGNGPSSNPVGLTRLGARALFFACQDATVGLYATTGHPGSTRRLHTLTTACDHFTTHPPLEDPPPIVVVADLAFHRADRDGTIWRSDGTSEGTFALASFSAGQVFGPVAVGEHIVFLRQTGIQGTGTLGYEVWESDGSLAGTALKSTLRGIGLVFELYGAEDRFYFTGSSAGFPALTASDGTQAGTRLLIRVEPRPRAASKANIAEQSFVRFAGHDYFGFDGTLWRTDGTSEGTESLGSLFPGPELGSRIPIGLTPWNGALYFLARIDSFPGTWGLWRTDGTAAGTELLTALPGGNPFTFSALTPFGDRLAFIATITSGDDVLRQLWFSDGTAAGTAPLAVDLGDFELASPELTAWNGKLYFSAGPEPFDLELWESDGTIQGTRLRQEISPGRGPAEADPRTLTPLPDRLLFAASDGFFGREIWALPAGDGHCEPRPHTLCLGRGRYQAEVVVQDAAGRSLAGEAASLTPEAGAFSFFRAGNLDLFLKVLDGSAVNGRGWVFVGSLSDASFTLTLTDTQTGAARRYANPSGKLASFADTAAFNLGSALLAGDVSLAAPGSFATSTRIASKAGAGACTSAPERLCLVGGRYAVEIDWRAAAAQGHAVMVPGSDTSGTFWFFRAANLEGAVKMLDGTAVNGHAWFFFTGLTNLELTIRVRDTTTGAVRTYTKTRGNFAAFADVEAL